MLTRTALLIFTLASFSVNAERLKVQHVFPELPHSTYQSQVIPANSFGASSADPKAAALSFVSRTFGLNPRDYVVSNAYTSDDVGVTHVYLRQLFKGLEVTNADMNINVDRNGNIISYGNSFFPVAKAQDVKPWFSSSAGFVSPTKAFNTLTRYLKLEAPINVREISSSGLNGSTKYELQGVPFAEGNVKVEQTYIQLSNNKLVPAWKFNLRMSENWFDACVQADGSKVVFLNDWVSDFSYNAIPINKDNPLEGIEMIVDPEDLTVSPAGWLKEDINGAEFDTTKGNNVYAQENLAAKSDPLNNRRPSASNGKFGQTVDLTKDPKEYVDASTVNLFYACNKIHDVFYKYGFNEQAGNFQKNNFDKGGKGNDFVIANAQDGSGTNNANMASPPDGQNGKMRMYVFTSTTPRRDGTLENGIILHEYGHGISTRLTGGPANSNCLGSGQSGGMGEGWSDFFSILFQLNKESSNTKDVAVGHYVLNKPNGIRVYPYSTDMTRNPTTFDYLNKFDWKYAVHRMGEIWCNMLWQVYWNFAKVMGKDYNPDLQSVDLTSPNTLLLKVLIEAMKIQPCKPSFVDARDAMFTALKALVPDSGKPNTLSCAMWEAFAKRGLGEKAKVTGSSVTQDFTVPESCRTKV